MRRDLWIALLLAVLTLGLFWPAEHHDFIDYDDPQFVTENPQIQSGLSWKTVVYAFTRPVAANWHPVTTLSHALDCELFGTNPGPPHLVNAVLHALNAALLFLALQKLTGRPDFSRGEAESPQKIQGRSDRRGDIANYWPPWAGIDRVALRNALIAALFALHPLRVESVAWLAERKDLLAGFFFLLSLWAYAAHIQKSGKRESEKRKHGKRETGTPRHVSVVRVSAFSLSRFPLFSLGCFALGLMSKPMVVTLPFVLLLLDYWPLGRFRPGKDAWNSSARRLRYEKVPFFALSALACWVTLVVQRTAGAVQTAEHLGWAERITNAITSYTRYLGKLFWPANLAAFYPHPAKHYFLTDAWPGWEIGAAALMLTGLTLLCLVELRRRPCLAVGWFWFLGMLVPVIGLVQVGEQAMADRYTYLPTIGIVLALVWGLADLRPRSGESSQRLGFLGPKRQVVGRFFAVAGSVSVLVLLAGLTRHQLSYWQNSVTLFDHTIQVTADNPPAQFALAVGLEAAGQTNQAMVHYRVAVAIDPTYTKAYYNMGQILRKTGYWPEAAKAYQAAARGNPDDTATQLNLASVLARLGRTREAVEHFNKALELDPQSLEGLNNLAWLLSTSPGAEVRDGARAVQLAEQACNLSGYKTPVFLGTLAAAYAEAGRFTNAVATAQNAAALAAQAGDTATAAKNQELAELYRSGKAYRADKDESRE